MSCCDFPTLPLEKSIMDYYDDICIVKLFMEVCVCIFPLKLSCAGYEIFPPFYHFTYWMNCYMICFTHIMIMAWLPCFHNIFLLPWDCCMICDSQALYHATLNLYVWKVSSIIMCGISLIILFLLTILSYLDCPPYYDYPFILLIASFLSRYILLCYNISWSLISIEYSH